jgi:hypothetical protein
MSTAFRVEPENVRKEEIVGRNLKEVLDFLI